MSDRELTPDEKALFAVLRASTKAALQKRSRTPPLVHHRTAEQFDLQIASAVHLELKRLRKQWWERFWLRVQRLGIVIGVLAGITVIAANTGFCRTPPLQ